MAPPSPPISESVPVLDGLEGPHPAGQSPPNTPNKGSSLSDSTVDFCRICHCGSDVEELISPCHCSGSLGYIHQSCLQEWLGNTNKKFCELCRYEFKLHATMRPLSKWRLLSLSRYERRKIVCSVTFHFLAITCVVWSIWVLLQRLIQEATKSELGWAFWTKVVVVVIGFTGGCSFVFAQVKMYYSLFKRWRSFNKVILIVDKDTESCTADPLYDM